MGCTVRSHLRWSRRWESVMSLTSCPWKARSVTLSPCPWEARGVTPSRAQPRVPRARHQQLLHLPLIPRLHSTFAAPTSAGPHCLLQSVGLKTHEERRKPPSYICDRLAYSVLDGAESGGGGAGAAAPRPAAIMWRCSRQGETHIVEWRAVDAPVGRHRVLPPKLSDSVRLAIGAARQAPRTAQCQCGVFPACPHADAVTGASGVVWVDSDLRTTAIQLEGHKPSRQFDYCVRRAHAAAARRLLGSTSTKSRVSLSVAVHLPAPVHNIANRNYTGIGPFSLEWMDQHVLDDE